MLMYFYFIFLFFFFSDELLGELAKRCLQGVYKLPLGHAGSLVIKQYTKQREIGQYMFTSNWMQTFLSVCYYGTRISAV